MEGGLINPLALIRTGAARGVTSEEFAQVWDEAQRDLANGAVARVDNLVEWVSTAREGFNDNPRHLLVLLQRGERCRLTRLRLTL